MERNELSRIEGFRQLRREIRGSEEYLLVGIDVAKRRHRAFFGTATGRTLLRRLIFANSRESFYGHCEAENLAVVRWCLQPTVISGMSYEQFFQTVTRRDRGIGQHRRLRALWEEAASSIGCAGASAVAFEAELVVESLKQIRQAIAGIEAKVKELASGFPAYAHLLTIPGFGPDVSAKVIAALGDPFRFTRGKQVLKLAGFDLSASRSGKSSEAATPVISKRGKADLRYALYQAALIASIRNRHFMAYYTGKLRGRERERGIRTKMRVKLAAKMLVIAWTLMKKKEPFSPEYLNGS